MFLIRLYLGLKYPMQIGKFLYYYYLNAALACIVILIHKILYTLPYYTSY